MTSNPEVWTNHPDGVSAIDYWHCPHDMQSLGLLTALEHIREQHPDCFFCACEVVVIRAILQVQGEL